MFVYSQDSGYLPVPMVGNSPRAPLPPIIAIDILMNARENNNPQIQKENCDVFTRSVIVVAALIVNTSVFLLLCVNRDINLSNLCHASVTGP